jgi:hypothetical protein
MRIANKAFESVTTIKNLETAVTDNGNVFIVKLRAD